MQLSYRELKSPLYVIREIYDGQDSYEKFILELDKALDERYETIIIEPPKVGEETSSWIRVGNCLHQTAIVAGVGSLAATLVWPHNLHISASLCCVSTFCCSIYWISWSYDPCVKYQVERNPVVLKHRIPNYSEFASPVVLKYKDNKYVKCAHRSVSLLAAAFCLYRVYQVVRGGGN